MREAMVKRGRSQKFRIRRASALRIWLLVLSSSCCWITDASSSDAWNEYQRRYPDDSSRRRRPDERNEPKRPEQPPEWWQEQADDARDGGRSAAAGQPLAPTAPPSEFLEDEHPRNAADRRLLPTAPPSEYMEQDASSGSRSRYDEYGSPARTDDGGPRPPPPPQNPQYTPIHYQFRPKTETMNQPQQKKRWRRGDKTSVVVEEDDAIPVTWNVERDTPQIPAEGDDGTRPYAAAAAAASPRQDAVTRYMSTTQGRLLLRLSSGTVGMGVGGFIGKSFLNKSIPVGLVCFTVMVICTFLRNPFGELSRALGLALIFALQRTRAIRRRYPSWPHIKSCLQAGPRIPFPRGVNNPWSYEGDDFRMLYTVMAMAIVGSACGGNLPLVPTWIGALAGAVFFSFITTFRSSRGDLARTMGMRVVSLVEEVFDINDELSLMYKSGVVTGRIFDKLLILDRKHRIKDKLVSMLSWMYNKVSRTAEQIQSDMQEGADDEPRRPETRRPGDFDRRDERRDNRR